MRPIPMASVLVPPVRVQVPDGFARIETALVSGLPATIDLDRDLSLVLLLPTGLARPWRDRAAAESVASSADQLAAVGPPEPDAPPLRAPLRVQARQAGRTLGVAPLVVGQRVRVAARADDDPPAGAPPAAALEYVVLEWDVRAGSVRGAADAGSRLVVAWRRADRAVERFSEPPVNPYFAPRLAPQKRVESTIFDRRYLGDIRLVRMRLVSRAIVRTR